jgi:Zn-dependent peptidase ImmA (M78 family)
LGLALGSISDLRGLLETQGVYVFELPIRTGEFSGCSQWHEEYGPCILVNARDTEGRRNFTLAHEYYHLLVERGVFHVCSVDPTARLPEERPANDFAAAFLMTRPGLERALTERRRESPLQEAKDYAPIARKWRVSVEALLYALGDFGLVPKQQVDRLLSEWEAPPVRRKKGTRLPVRWQRRLKHLGKAYTQGALRGYRDGHISLSKLADYLGIDIREARQAAEESR